MSRPSQTGNLFKKPANSDQPPNQPQNQAGPHQPMPSGPYGPSGPGNFPPGPPQGYPVQSPQPPQSFSGIAPVQPQGSRHPTGPFPNNVQGRHPTGPFPNNMQGSRHPTGPFPNPQGSRNPTGSLPNNVQGSRHPTGPFPNPQGSRNPTGSLPDNMQGSRHPTGPFPNPQGFRNPTGSLPNNVQGRHPTGPFPNPQGPQNFNQSGIRPLPGAQPQPGNGWSAGPQTQGPQNFNQPNQGWSPSGPAQGPQSFSGIGGPQGQGANSFSQLGNGWQASSAPAWGGPNQAPLPGQRRPSGSLGMPGGPGPMPGMGGNNQFPPQPPQHGQGPGSLQQRLPKRNVWQRARGRYQRLSRRSKVLLMVLAASLILPMLFSVVQGINAFIIYNQARSGLNHLTAAQAIYAEKDPKTGSSVLFDVNKLQRIQVEIDAALGDFTQVRDRVQNDVLIAMLSGLLPSQIMTVRSLSAIGVEGLEIAQEALKAAVVITPTLPDPTMKDETKPIVNTTMMDQGRILMEFALPRIQTIEEYSHQVDLASLPLSESQKNMLGTVLTVLPGLMDEVAMIKEFMDTGALDWLIGAEEPRSLLVQTQDRGELRPTGGFTGQFGVMTINGGRIGPLKLENIGLYEKNVEFAPEQNPIYTDYINGNTPPEQFDWWPIPNFGMRDSNVSADFPTSAQLALDIFNSYYEVGYEGYKPVDGLVVFSPFFIAQIIRATGPITIGKYNETITADNLEEKIHYYQLDNEGVWKIINLEKLTESDYEEARKIFTQRLAEALMDRMKNLSPEMVVNLVPTLLQAMQTRDLQAYFTNDQAQDLITKYGSAATMDPLTEQDGVFVVHTNVSVSKASQYVRTYIRDTVTLDNAGGATHNMSINLNYTQIGQVYGFDTYMDYLRIYLPQNSQVLWGDGFSQLDQKHCSSYFSVNSDAYYGVYTPCEPDVFGDGALLCPPDVDQLMFPAFSYESGYNYHNGFTKIGPPTNTTSDQPGLQMVGGWVHVPKNCNMTVQLSWYVPNAVKDTSYEYLFQRQAGTFPIVDMTILPAPGACGQLKTNGFYSHEVLGATDKLYNVKTGTEGNVQSGDCYPQMRV